VLNVMLFEMRAERISCSRNITLDWIFFRNLSLTESIFSNLLNRIFKFCVLNARDVIRFVYVQQ